MDSLQTNRTVRDAQYNRERYGLPPQYWAKRGILYALLPVMFALGYAARAWLN